MAENAARTSGAISNIVSSGDFGMADTSKNDIDNSRRGILACPQELIDQILADLTVRDFLVLRLVCLDYYRYFTDPGIVAYAHCLYFPRSSALLGGGSNAQYRSHVLLESGTSDLTAADFEAAHRCARRWRNETPTTVKFIDDVLDGSVVNSPNAIIVAQAEGLVVYQKAVGVLVVVDLNGHIRSGFPREQIVDLRALLGPCIVQKSETLRPGQPSQQIQMRLNKGTLLVIGQRHTHEMGRHTQSSSILQSRLFHPFSSSMEQTNIQQSISHTMCAVISLRPQDRGQVLHAWFDPDHFILASAHNPYYALIEFDMINNRIKGLVFPERAAKKRSSFLRGNSSPPGLGARFEILKRADYPSASIFKIAADDSGQHFFVGFANRNTNIPVVEVHAAPKLQADGTYSPPTVIKRVKLLHGMLTSLPGINRNRTSFRFRFESIMDLTEGAWDHVRCFQEEGDLVSGIKHLCLPKPDPEKELYERIRVVLSGAFSPDDGNRDVLGIRAGQFVDSVSWEISTKPSPRKPSSPLVWNQSDGRETVDQDEIDSEGKQYRSCFFDENGNYNREEAYPTPTVYLLPYAIKNIALHNLTSPPPSLGRLIARGDLIEYPHQFWRYDSPERASLCTLFYTPIRPASEDTTRLPYPVLPGQDDNNFIPPTRLLLASHLTSFTTGKWATHGSPSTKADPVSVFLSYLANPMLMTSLRAAIGLPHNHTPVATSIQPSGPTHTFLPSPIIQDRYEDPNDTTAALPVPRTLGKADISGDRRWLVYTVPRVGRYRGWEGSSQGEVGQYDGERIVVVRFDD